MTTATIESALERRPELVALLDRAIPLYMFGDSHALIYTDLVFDEQKYLHQHFVTRAKYIPGLQAATFLDDKGNLHQAISQALISEGLLEPGPGGGWLAFHQADTIQAKSTAVARGSGRISPIMAFFCGDIDLRLVFIKQFAPASDFTIPNDVYDPSRFEPYRIEQTVPFSLALELAKKLMNPLFVGLAFLARMGFSNLYLGTLVPPALDDREYERSLGYFAPAALRYKSTRLFNAVIREFGRVSGVRILDMWDRTTTGGVLEPAFALGDHVHLNKRAAALTVDTLVHDMLNRSRSAANPLWETARVQASEAYQGRMSSVDASLRERFARENIVTFDAGREFADGIRANVDYAFDMGNKHPRFDWCGNTIEPCTEFMRSARPSVAVLDQVFEKLLTGELQQAIATCMESDFSVLQLRVFKSLPHSEGDIGPQGYHLDGTPPGMLRGVMYLVDVDEEGGPFEYLDDEGVAHKVIGPAGTLLVFNANRYKHRGSAPIARHRENLDFVFAPLVPGDRPRVMWAGMNNWPIDPFCYSTRDFAISYGQQGAAG